MKFEYEYRTSGNELRRGSLSAADRDEVYSRLKAEGIRPSRVIESPGFFNRLFGKGKRWLAIAALVGISASLALYVYRLQGTVNEVRQAVTLGAQPRHQIYADPAVLERLEREDFASVFTNAGDRVLARFAQPGREVRKPSSELQTAAVAALKSLLGAPSPTFPDMDSSAADFKSPQNQIARELVAIVLWMRGEFSDFQSAGGTAEEYFDRLLERQRRESLIYLQAKNELKGKTDEAEYERRNEQLRRLGIRTIPQPE